MADYLQNPPKCLKARHQWGEKKTLTDDKMGVVTEQTCEHCAARRVQYVSRHRLFRGYVRYRLPAAG